MGNGGKAGCGPAMGHVQSILDAAHKPQKAMAQQGLSSLNRQQVQCVVCFSASARCCRLVIAQSQLHGGPFPGIVKR